MNPSLFSPVLTALLCGHRLAHESHLNVRGPTAGSDHELFGRVYNELLTAYDLTRELVSVVCAVDIRQVSKDASASFAEKSSFLPSGDAEHLMRAVLKDQTDLLKLVEALSDKMEVSAGLRAHFQDLARSTMHRVYFLKARLGQLS